MNRIKTSLIVEKRGGCIICSTITFNKITITSDIDKFTIFINEIPCLFTIKDIRWINKALKS